MTESNTKVLELGTCRGLRSSLGLGRGEEGWGQYLSDAEDVSAKSEKGMHPPRHKGLVW